MDAYLLTSIVMLFFGILGVIVPSFFKDEDEKLGIRALFIAFLVGMVVVDVIFASLG